MYYIIKSMFITWMYLSNIHFLTLYLHFPLFSFYIFTIKTHPLGIRLRIGTQYPLLVLVNGELNDGASVETAKTEAPCQSSCSTIKTPPCSTDIIVERMFKFYCPSSTMVSLCIREVFLNGTPVHFSWSSNALHDMSWW